MDGGAMNRPSGLVLIRHQDGVREQEGTLPAELHVDSIRIQSDHLRDLSTNLLGVFQKDDIRFDMAGERRAFYYGLWQEGEAVDPPGEEDYKVREHRSCYFIPVDKLLEEQVSHHGDIFRFRLFHTPTRCNFWHVSIRMVDDNGNEAGVASMTNSSRRKLWTRGKQLLLTSIIEMECEMYCHLPQQAYCK